MPYVELPHLNYSRSFTLAAWISVASENVFSSDLTVVGQRRWERLFVQDRQLLAFAASTTHPGSGRFFVFGGGFNTDPFYSDLVGPGPSLKRHRWVEVGNELFVFSGYDFGNPEGQVYNLDVYSFKP